VQGSVEVIRHELAKLDHEEVAVKLVHAGVGQITESDVDLAEASGATLVAFHTGIPGKIRKDAERRKLTVRRYDVIYELLDQLRDLMEGSLSPEIREEVVAHAEVKALFKSSKIGIIAGCGVTDGTLKRIHKVRALRDGAVVHTGSIESLRREKDDAREVREGFDCGIVLANFSDLREGDVIEAFILKEIKRTLA
jgi:translation initiation factor IF-2